MTYPPPEPTPAAPAAPAAGWAPPAPADRVPDAAFDPASAPVPAAAPAPRPPWVSRHELRAGAVVVGVLVLVGVVAGFVWLWWAPPRGIALALGPHTLLPDETEDFVAADGRYALIALVLGVLAGVGAWLWRSTRGPVMAVALAVGSGAGAALTALVGRLFGGGVTGASSQKIVTPPLELRALGLLALQAAVALLVYGLSVTVSARDDLGVGDPVTDDDRADDDLAPDTLEPAPPAV